ncbi:MAG TPA: HEPN domain-containing protein [Methanosarcinales archaeon]|nr:HEPN domain-containing protein [Methanosarcinales archaeon]
MDRSRDWLRQAERDLEETKLSFREGFYEWACFLAQQSAEKAVKAISEFEKMQSWGHVISRILKDLSPVIEVSSDIMDKARILDRYYIPTRYPNGFESGAPMDYYTKKDAQEAIEYAEELIKFARQHIQR